MTERPAMLQLVDHRGNVVIVDGGVRLTGTLAAVPALFAEGAEVDVTLIVGFEPVRLRVVVLEGAAARPGAIAVVSLREWVAGGRVFKPEEEDAPGMQGRLSDLSLVDVIQLLSSGQRTAVIEVLPEGAAPGALALRSGQVVYACCHGLVGEDALFSLLGVLHGRFRVRFDRPPPGALNVQRETTFLLLEHLRRIDEAGRGPVPRLESVPDGSVVVRPAMSAPTVAVPSALSALPEKVEKPKRKKEKPQTQEEQHKPAGAFARFFDEAGDAPRVEKAEKSAPPPIDDTELGVTDAVRFASLAVRLNPTASHKVWDRDTDIVSTSHS